MSVDGTRVEAWIRIETMQYFPDVKNGVPVTLAFKAKEFEDSKPVPVRNIMETINLLCKGT